MAKTAETAERLLHILQEEAERWGLELNLEKCEMMKFNTEQKVHFKLDTEQNQTCGCRSCVENSHIKGVQLREVNTTKYLGVTQANNSDPMIETRARMAKAATYYRMLKPFFNHAGLSGKWRLRIYEAIFQSLITYAAETMWHTPLCLQKMDTLHFKVLRRILPIKSTYDDKIFTEKDEVYTDSQISTMIRKKNKQKPLTMTQ